MASIILPDKKENRQPLACGSFGCVFYPPLPCKSDPSLDKKYEKGYVMKVENTEHVKDDLRRMGDVHKRFDRILTPSQRNAYNLGEKQICDQPDISDAHIIPGFERDVKLAFAGMYFPYLDGVPIEQYIRKTDTRQFPDTTNSNSLDKFITSLVTAVVNMHKSGVVHNDLNIYNVMVGADFDANIIDFGNSDQIDTPPRQADDVQSMQHDVAQVLWLIKKLLAVQAVGSKSYDEYSLYLFNSYAKMFIPALLSRQEMEHFYEGLYRDFQELARREILGKPIARLPYGL